MKIVRCLLTIAFIAIVGVLIYVYVSMQAPLTDQEGRPIDESVYDELSTTVTSSTDSDVFGVDFVSLLARNDDVVAWLHIPDTNISYPVMQESTINEYNYLYRDIDNKWNGVGSLLFPATSIPMDELATPVIHGHNVYNSDSMFGDLSVLYTSTNNAPYLELHYASGVFEYYKVVANLDTTTSNILYQEIEKGSTQHQDILDDIWSNNLFTMNPQLEVDDELLFLSSCNSTQVGQPNRQVIVAKQISFSQYDR